MSKRPASIYNDPGYFYDQRKLLKIFVVSSLALCAGIIAMIWADWDRPWKHTQRAQLEWDARKMALENWILRVKTQKERRALSRDRKAAAKEIAAKREELAALRSKIDKAQGSFVGGDRAFKDQKQYTTQADYQVHEAHTEGELEYWKSRLLVERDLEMRLRDETQESSARLEWLLAKEQELQGALDEIVARERSDPKLKRMKLLEANIEKKRSYNPVREIPLIDFLAPPTHVEQVVLDNLVDNYEFSTPKKVDRCGTCHIGSMRQGFEAPKFPVEILEPGIGGAERAKRFEEAVYRFVRSIVEGYTARVDGNAPFAHERGVLRDLEIHHQTLGLMFADYDPDSGEIGLDDKGRKIWRKWRRDKKRRWKTTKSEKGVGIDQYYLTVLQRMEGSWRTHPHFSDMVGDGSPHPYEQFGCSICHLGRGWSTDFGFAYHTPDRTRIEDWMTTERAEEEHRHLPLNAHQTLEEAMAKGNPEGNPIHVGFVTDEETGHRWEQELGWTHTKRHHWHWPQHAKSLVQSSCMKCHKEGLYETPAEEYENVNFGRPDPGVPSLLDYELHAREYNDDAEAEAAGEYAGRLFIPEAEETYRPESLEKGMDNFLRFGCYGCHKLDPVRYPFMSRVRPRIGPQLDDLATKTSREFVQKWVRDPKDFRSDTRMPAFWGLSNNSHKFVYRFAKEGVDPADPVDGKQWGDMEVYAISEWLWQTSLEEGREEYPAIDLSKADPANGERILVGDYDASGAQAKACIACHEVPITTPELKYDEAKVADWEESPGGASIGWKARMSRRQGPDLTGIGSKVKAAWLFAWLQDPNSYWHNTNMPDLRLTEQEALDVTAYLLGSKHEEFDKLPGIGVDMPTITRMAEELKVGEQKEPTEQAYSIVSHWSDDRKVQYVGKQLFKHYGCFGCHLVEEYKDATPIGTELTEWGSKLIARLEFNHAPIAHERFDFGYTKMMNPRIYDLGMPRKDLPYQRLKMPRFGFEPDEARELATFLISLVSDPIPDASLFHPDQRQSEIIAGRQLVRQYNCQGCHVIEGEGGDVWPTIAKEKWRPPDLLGQGRKTNPQWLFRFMKDPGFVTIPGVKGSDRVRPWHSIRMPSFGFRDDQARAIVRYFGALSRTATDFETSEPDGLTDPGTGYPKRLTVKDAKDQTKEITVTVRNRLEEAEAMFNQYQCKSCHSSDESVPIGNRAPNFRHTAGGRLREAWIGHWLWNPSRLQPGTAMPAFFINEQDGKIVPKAQDEQFFDSNPDEQIRAVRDFIRHHYREDEE